MAVRGAVLVARCWLCCCLLLIFPVQALEPIRISVTDWPPYIQQSRDDGGLALKVIRAALAEEGVAVEFEWLPWVRSLDYARRGKRDASALWYYTSPRAQRLHYSAPILRHRINLYMLREHAVNWRRLEDLSGYQVGAVNGYSYGEHFDVADQLGILQVQRVVQETQNIQKLLGGRIDLVVAEARNFEWLLQQLPASERGRIVAHPRPVDFVNSHVLVSPEVADYRLYLERLNRGMQKLEAKGVLQRWLGENAPRLGEPAPSSSL